MRYAWRGLRFQVADNADDQSTIALVIDNATSVTIAREAEGGSNLDAFVKGAMEEVATSVSGYRLIERSSTTIGGRPSILLRQEAITPEGGSLAQIEHLTAKGTALHVVGQATRGDERVGFDWDIPVSFGHRCKIDQRVRTNSGGRTEMTIHADHLLLDDLGPDGQISFDLIAASDVDSDGLVIPAELAQTSILPLARYQTAGMDIKDLWTYIGNLALTLGHVDGEGGCDPVFTPARYAGITSPGSAPGQGAALYAKHCASCHGSTGQGDGPGAAGLSPAPANLADHDYTPGRVAQAPWNGVAGTAMSGWRDHAPADLAAFVTAVRALRSGAQEPAPADGQLEQGATVYQQHCAQCHGARGDGQGTAAPQLAVAPADFTAQRATLARATTAIRRGVPGTPMAPFTTELTDADVAAVAHYVRAFYTGAPGAGRP